MATVKRTRTAPKAKTARTKVKVRDLAPKKGAKAVVGGRAYPCTCRS